jgi:hypothetical protein
LDYGFHHHGKVRLLPEDGRVDNRWKDPFAQEKTPPLAEAGGERGKGVSMTS